MGLKARSQAYGKLVADETISVGASVVSLTVPSGVHSALITARGANVSYRYGPSDPTASAGHVILDGGNIEIFEGDLAEVSFIAESGSASLFVSYYKEV